MVCAPSEDSDQPVPPTSSGLRCPHEESLGDSLQTVRTAKTLIRLGIRPVWSESSLGAQATLFVLSRGGSYNVMLVVWKGLKCHTWRVWKTISACTSAVRSCCLCTSIHCTLSINYTSERRRHWYDCTHAHTGLGLRFLYAIRDLFIGR